MVALIFDKRVKTVQSHLQIEFRTLVSKYGGIIGLCKNLLWLIMLTSAAFIFCSKKLLYRHSLYNKVEVPIGEQRDQ